MPENTQNSGQNECSCQNTPTDSVCIDAQRVYDSCGDKDCLSDLKVYFTEAEQAKVNSARDVKVKEVEVISVFTDLDCVPFHRGFYSVDMTFVFKVTLETCESICDESPTKITGMAYYEKKVFLYGSEGNIKTFTSDYNSNCENCGMPANTYPQANVQVASPISLSSKLVKKEDLTPISCKIPECIRTVFGGEFITETNPTVYVTIGMFSVVQIVRNVQLLVPTYEFNIPSKTCVTESDNPCEVFAHLDFPANEFYPPNVTELNCDDNGNFCGHCK